MMQVFWLSLLLFGMFYVQNAMGLVWKHFTEKALQRRLMGESLKEPLLIVIAGGIGLIAYLILCANIILLVTSSYW